MKKIILLGDSVRKGYDEHVAKKLEGVAEIYYPEDNCRFAAYLFRYLSRYVEQSGFGAEVDVIHWNAGLWDTIIQYQEDRLTSPEVYREYITRIHKRIKQLYPNAIEIFATSTRVREELYSDDFLRRNADVEWYNKIAVEVLAEEGVIINDLYDFTKEWTVEYYSDKTHFNEMGSEFLGNKVAEVLKNELHLQ